jgi:hypothetical protein
MEITARRASLGSERRFFVAITAVIIAAILAGFAPSWFLRPWLYRPEMLPFTPLVWLHGLLFTGWALLFMTQVGLVSAGRLDVHRRLGIVGVGFAVAMAVVGTFAALYGVARASGPPGIPPLSFLAVPLLSVPIFAGLILTGLHFRRRPDAHKRLMLLAMIGFLPPALGRMPIFSGPLGTLVLPTLFIVALGWWDVKSRGRIHRATVWGGLADFLGFLTPMLIWNTSSWLGFARWASGLVA